MKNALGVVCLTGVLLFGFMAPAFAIYLKSGGYSPEMQAKIEETNKELKKFIDEKAMVDKNIKTFDDLDFVVFSNQEWTRLHESHSKDVKVNWLAVISRPASRNTLKTSRPCSCMRLIRA